MQVSVRTTDNVVLQHGSGLGELTGTTLVDLTSDQEAAFEALATPNGGVTFSSGTFTVLPFVPPMLPPGASAVPGSGAGTSASVALHQPDPSMSTDVRCIVDVTVGSSPTADANGHYPLAVVTFGAPYPMAPLGVMVDRVGANAVALGLVFSDSLATTGYTLIAQNAPVAGQTYRLSAALG